MKPKCLGWRITIIVFFSLLVYASYANENSPAGYSHHIRDDLIDQYVANVCAGLGLHLDTIIFQRNVPTLLISRQNAHKCFLGAGDISDDEIQILAIYELNYTTCKKNARREMVDDPTDADQMLQLCIKALPTLNRRLRERNAQLKQCVEFAMLTSYPVEPYDPRPYL